MLAATIATIVIGGSLARRLADPGFDTSDPAYQFALALVQQRGAWLQAFVASGQDPRTLPLSEFEVHEPLDPINTVARARKEAQLIVRGRVVSVDYFSDVRALGHTRSLATIEVERTVKGKHRAAIEVVQSGGPEENGGKPVLTQFMDDPLLLPGDEVILLLVPARSPEHRAAGRYSTVWGAGVYSVTDQGVYAVGRNRLAGEVSGRRPEDVLRLFE